MNHTRRIAIAMVAAAIAMSSVGCTGGKNGGKQTEAETTASQNREEETTTAENTKKEFETEIYWEHESESKCLELADAIWKAYDTCGQENRLDAALKDDELYMSPVGSMDMSRVEAYACYQNSISSVNPDALTVVKVDSDYVDEAVQLCNDTFNQNMDYQKLYPFAEAEVSGCRIYTSGDYVIYLIAGPEIAEDATEEEAQKAVDEVYEQMDAAIRSVFPDISENQAVKVESDDSSDGDDEEFEGEGGLLR